jgi:hypothetical protein
MLFSFNRHRPLFNNNTILNDYIKNNNHKYMHDIVKDVEYKNQRKKIFGDEEPKGEVSLVIPSVFLLSLTRIIYYFLKIGSYFCFLL